MNMSSTTNIIRIYSQNVRKNYVLVDSLLESQKDLYNILFIQKPHWNFIRFAPSTSSPGGQEIVGAPIHSEWTQVVQFPYAGQSLRDLADSYSLVYLLSVLPVPIHYLDISGHANSVIDLIFLDINCAQVIYCIEPDLRRPSDHAPLIVNLSIASENIQVHRKVLKQDSEEKAAFLLSVSEELS